MNPCAEPGCEADAIVALNGRWLCRVHFEAALVKARAAIDAAVRAFRTHAAS